MVVFDVALLAFGGWAAYAFAKLLNRKIEKRKALNRLLAVASQDFHDAAKKVLQTPGDLPDSVLDRLSIMSRTGFQRGSEKAFLSAIKAARAAPPEHGRPGDFIADLESLRPELRALVLKAMAAWFNIMTHKSGRYHDKIAIETIKAEAERMPPDRQAIAAASNMQAVPC